MTKNWEVQAIGAREYSREIIMHAEEHHQRTGQYLFNSLPDEVRIKVTGKHWDPFSKDLSQDQIERWLNKYIIFDANGKIVKLIEDHKLIWERKF